ncbi:hypothetical protein DIPPA_62143 [Diplonema papillatum]|nr:hypothetical protein DIPPA_62143 [Diplonema papillatum]
MGSNTQKGIANGRWLLAVLSAASVSSACTPVALGSEGYQIAIDHENNVDLCWEFSCSDPRAIGSLAFTRFASRQDFVYVGTEPYHGSTLPPVTIFEAGSTLAVNFSSNDNTVSGTGFTFQATCCQVLNVHVVEPTEPQVVELLSSDHATDACWVLDYRCGGARGELNFRKFDTEKENVVYVGDNAYSGADLPPTTSASGPIRIEFSSDRDTNGGGFSALASCCDSELVSSPGDWTCSCSAQTVGDTAPAATATCLLDECATQGCGPSQDCFDPDTAPSSTGDWTCSCPAPSVGDTATGSAATCTLDECATQSCGPSENCLDPYTDASSTGDWTCSCRPPNLSNAAKAASAVCVLDTEVEFDLSVDVNGLRIKAALEAGDRIQKELEALQKYTAGEFKGACVGRGGTEENCFNAAELKANANRGSADGLQSNTRWRFVFGVPRSKVDAWAVGGWESEVAKLAATVFTNATFVGATRVSALPDTLSGGPAGRDDTGSLSVLAWLEIAAGLVVLAGMVAFGPSRRVSAQGTEPVLAGATAYASVPEIVSGGDGQEPLI